MHLRSLEVIKRRRVVAAVVAVEVRRASLSMRGIKFLRWAAQALKEVRDLKEGEVVVGPLVFNMIRITLSKLRL